MGLLIRQCDQFCEAHDMFGLFCQMRDVCKQVLELPHARLWQIDRERNSVLCLYNNTVRGLIKAPALALDLPSAALLVVQPRTLLSSRRTTRKTGDCCLSSAAFRARWLVAARWSSVITQ